jgi:hypothetical protein
VVPGLIDPHEHLLGAGGEEGFGSREPEVAFEEVVRAGITTVVGCLGTDTTTRPIVGLLGKAWELSARGLTALLYTGGFAVPPRTLMGRVDDDLALVPEIVGVGELAISDERSYEPTTDELARIVSAAGSEVGPAARPASSTSTSAATSAACASCSSCWTSTASRPGGSTRPTATAVTRSRWPRAGPTSTSTRSRRTRRGGSGTTGRGADRPTA